MEYRDFKDEDKGRIVRGGRFLCLHKWQTDVVHGVWRYQECSRCSRRIAVCLYAHVYGVVDWHWLETGEWQPPPTVPPPGGLPGDLIYRKE